MPADHSGPISEQKRERIHQGKTFELDTANIYTWEKIEGDCFPADRTGKEVSAIFDD